MTFFTADDFNEILISPYDEKAASIANQKLQREAKVVYICNDPRKLTTIHFPQPVGATHTGLLICVEEIERKPCEHEPVPLSRMELFSEKIKIDMKDVKCAKCGVKLKAKWEVVDEQR